MSKKANPTAVGTFVMAALALFVIGIILFSSSKLFSKKVTFIVYFDASLNGLRIGAPVKFRGVNIGEVIDIKIRHNQAQEDLHVPVIFQINQDQLRGRIDRSVDLTDTETLKSMIDSGFRAKLATESFVTGVLYVSLDYNPRANPAKFHQLESEYHEIPSEPTRIEELMRNLAEFNLSELTDKLDAILDRLDASLNELNVKQINDGIVNTLAAAEDILENPELGGTIKNLRQILEKIEILVSQLNEKFDPFTERINRTLDGAAASLEQVDEGVHDLRDLLAPQSPVAHELRLALNEITKAAQAIAEFVDFLNRNPKALITGKDRSDTTP